MKKMNFYFNGLKAVIAMVMVFATINMQAQVSCIGGSPTSPGANFTLNCNIPAGDAAIQPQDVVIGALSGTGACSFNEPILASLSGASIANNVAGLTPYIGKVILASVTYQTAGPDNVCNTADDVNASCWGYIKIEDKTPPVVSCPAAITLQCTDANSGALLPIATTGTSTGAPTVTECSSFTTSYSDVVVWGACAGSGAKVVTRTWSAKDAWGNVSATCTQTITVQRPAYTDAELLALLPAAYKGSVDIACTDAPPAPLAVSAPVSIGCGITVSFVRQDRVALCGNSYKLVYTYQITDICPAGGAGASGMRMLISERTINAKDLVRPTLTVSGKSYDLVNGPSMATCAGVATSTLKKVQPSDQKAEVGGSNAATGTITINAWADSRVCGMGSFKLDVSGADECGTATLTSSDSRFPIVGGVINGTVMAASTTFVVTSTDQCGNISSVTVTVNYVDNISPTAVCDEVSATLNNYKEAILTGANFNHSSTDNCLIDRILIAKANADGSAGTWCDHVKYGCADVGANLKVWIRYIDATGNYTDCCVPLKVLDKAGIYCVNGGNASIECNDPRLSTYESLFKAPQVVYDGCSAITTNVSNSSEAINCGSGSFTRTWTYTITNSLGSVTSNACTSKITVTPVRGFRVTPLANANLTCSGDYTTKEQDLNTVRQSLKDIWGGSTTCSAPVVDVTETVYSNTEFCKIIDRTFVVKDICQISSLQSNVVNFTNIGTVVGGDLESIVTEGGHVIRFSRRITIRDYTAPTSTQITVAPICVTSRTCNFSFSQPLNGSDNCGTAASGSNLFYSWSVVNSAGNTVATGTSSTASASGLEFGTYTVYYLVNDLCGNISTRYSFTVTGSDCKAPEILVHDKIVALAGQSGVSSTGMASLFYEDIRNAVEDNCTDRITLESKIVMEIATERPLVNQLAPSTTTPTYRVMFNCSHVGTQYVRVWTRDNAGNWNYAISTITVQDNDRICSGAVVISGAARTENNAVVNNVAVSSGSASATVVNGSYSLTVAPGANVQVRATKTNNEDAASGVTTFDIAKISQHVLDIEKFVSPYTMIAADVDKSGEIDATDMLHMRRFILKITPSLPGGNFRFVDKAYTFRNPSNPFGEDFPEVVNFATLNANTSANFVAVKLGDVNGNYAALSPRSSRTLTFTANDMDLVAGNEYTVAIATDKLDAAAFQGTFSFNGAKVKSVKAGDLNNMTEGNFGIFANAVTTSWNGKTQAAGEVMTITFVANKSGKLSEMLTVNSELTQSVANDAAGNEMNVNLKFNTGKVAGGEFALYQNQPNPVANETTIGFNLPKDGQARLTITAVDGKVVKAFNGSFKAGYNTITVNKSDLNASGVFYYRLETADHSASKKMVIIE